MSPSAPAIFWFRQDLRLADHPGLSALAAQGRNVIPVFIWAPEEENPWPMGGASKWWLHQSLVALQSDLERIGSRLILRCGSSFGEIEKLIQETGADSVHWSRRYEPHAIARDTRIKEALRGIGIEAESHNAALLNEPWAIQNKSGKPYQVFTPFWKHCLTLTEPAEPLPAPKSLPGPKKWPKSMALSDLKLEPSIGWDAGMQKFWQPGEAGGQIRLKEFLAEAWQHYSEGRNRPDLSQTSRLSPYLHFGEISPRQIWHGVRNAAVEQGVSGWQKGQYLAEVGWREFSHHLIYHFPNSPTQPLRNEWIGFPADENSAALRAWQRGNTGYPIVDAGMRELWGTGWMHNRVRMIVASFLIKDLFLPWQEGARWFWDTLVDADLAQNTMGWQWTAGCGADAAPYFRIFNPISQGEKFDPNGDYVRQWIPEIASLPNEYLHSPWTAPPSVLKSAKVELGKTYPAPMVDHDVARKKALAAYAKLRGRE